MNRILHINFDVYLDKKVDHKVGGVPCAIQNIINYLSHSNKHNLLTFDSSINSPKVEDGNYIFPNLEKKYFSNFIRSPLKFFSAFKDVDIFVFHHIPPIKLLAYFRIIFPFAKFFCFVYTKQANKMKLYMRGIDLFLTTDEILRDNLISLSYPKHKVKSVGVIPDINKYDIKRNNMSFSFLNNGSKIWYSAGPRVEMGFDVFINEIINDTDKNHKYRITLLGEVEVSIRDDIQKMANVEVGGMYANVPKAMLEVDVMAYLIIDHKHKMHMPLMAIEAMLMKRIVITTLSGGMPCLFNKKNSIPVKKGAGFIAAYESFSEEELLDLAEKGYQDARKYFDHTIMNMEGIFS